MKWINRAGFVVKACLMVYSEWFVLIPLYRILSLKEIDLLFGHCI